METTYKNMPIYQTHFSVQRSLTHPDNCETGAYQTPPLTNLPLNMQIDSKMSWMSPLHNQNYDGCGMGVRDALKEGVKH